MRRSGWLLICLLVLAAVCAPARGEDLPEYRLKAAFLYNFAAFAEWPAEVGSTLNLCIHGKDPFGAEIDPLQGKKVGSRSLAIQRNGSVDSLKNCQIVFISASAISGLPRVLDALRGQPVLTVADSRGAAAAGVALNMAVDQNKVSFEANLRAARAAGVGLSARLLRLATEVIQ